MALRVVIKKYPNRRLYDTSAGRYVNLEDVAAQVRKGIDLQVVDARTGEDLTRVILSQIIMEEVKEQPLGLPLELLRQLILTTDRAGKEMLMWYLQPALDAYQCNGAGNGHVAHPDDAKSARTVRGERSGATAPAGGGTGGAGGGGAHRANPPASTQTPL